MILSERDGYGGSGTSRSRDKEQGVAWTVHSGESEVNVGLKQGASRPHCCYLSLCVSDKQKDGYMIMRYRAARDALIITTRRNT